MFKLNLGIYLLSLMRLCHLHRTLLFTQNVKEKKSQVNGVPNPYDFSQEVSQTVAISTLIQERQSRLDKKLPSLLSYSPRPQASNLYELVQTLLEAVPQRGVPIQLIRHGSPGGLDSAWSSAAARRCRPRSH